MNKTLSKGVAMAAIAAGPLALIAPQHAAAAHSAPQVAIASPQPAALVAPLPEFQGGWDRDHFWIKITKGEIAQGATWAICRYFAGPLLAWKVCPPITNAVKAMVGNSNGVWIEIFKSGRVRMGTW